MGFFDKLKKITTNLFSGFSEADEAFFEELEETLILADLGMDTALDAVEKLRTRVRKEKLQDQEAVKAALRDILAEEMDVGGTELDLSTRPAVVLFIGVNGVGKTTSIGKLGYQLKSEGKRVLFCAADTFRAAAADQLQIWAERAGCELVRQHEGADPGAVLFDALQAAKARGVDVVLCDTAGRLHNKANLMAELAKLSKIIDRECPGAARETLLVLDATTGQNAVHQAEEFNKAAHLTGIVLTKLDGDARGGAALSMRAITGKPIKFAGTGEKIDNIEPFHPERMASRILGMGDVLTLIEKAQETFDLEQAAAMEQKLRRADFTLQDFLEQMQQVQKMGSPDELAAMLPGVSAKDIGDPEQAQKHLKRTEAIIYSMTPQERRRPEILNASRRKRIAAGSGVKVSDVNRMLNEFESIRKMIKQFTGNKRMKKRGFRGMKLPF